MLAVKNTVGRAAPCGNYGVTYVHRWMFMSPMVDRRGLGSVISYEATTMCCYSFFRLRSSCCFLPAGATNFGKKNVCSCLRRAKAPGMFAFFPAPRFYDKPISPVPPRFPPNHI